jgi:hypothetical protein
MKTGGYSLATQLWKQFPTSEVYGSYGQGESEFLTSTYLYLNPRPMTRMSVETISGFSIFSGHFPYAARELMGEVTTATILRDPVERVISFLKHAQRFHNEHRGLSLEEIYEDEWYFPRFLDNHEVKILSMTADEMLIHSATDGWDEEGWIEEDQALLRLWREEPATLSDEQRLRFHNLAVPVITTAMGVYRLIGAPNTAVVDVDERRLRQATANLRDLDIVGVFEEYDEFMRTLSSTLGFDLSSRVRRNVSKEQEVSQDLRRRISSQLGPSLELYETARALVRERSNAS